MSAGCSVERQGGRNNKDEVRNDDQLIISTAKIFTHPISQTESTQSKIGDRHATYFRKVSGLTIADLGVDKV